MNDEEGSMFLLQSNPNNEDETAKKNLDRTESPNNSFVQRLLNTMSNDSVTSDKLSASNTPSPHQVAMANGSAHSRETGSADNILTDASKVASGAGDQWIHGHLDDYMMYQSLGFPNGASLGDGGLPSDRLGQVAGDGVKAETGSSLSSTLCQLCNKTYSSRSHLLRHMESHSTLRPYKCDQCNKAFRNTSRLKRHKEIHAGLKPYKCPLCDSKLSRKEHLKRHLMIHTDSRPFKCSLCSFSGKRIDSVKHHIRQRHAEGLASVTTMQFNQSVMQNLLNQLQASINMQQQQNSPGESSSQQTTSGSKKKKKKKKKKSKNGHGYAGIMTSQQQDELMGLILNNSVVPPVPIVGKHQCEVCNRSFTDNAKLTRHKVSHMAVKPFVCDLCGTRLSRQDHLKRHMYMHESSHPLVCGSCRYSTNKLSDLRNHIKTEHPGERIRILSALTNSNSNGESGETSQQQTQQTTTSTKSKKGGKSKQVTSAVNNTGGLSLADALVLPQGESIYSAGTWCPSIADTSSSSSEAASQPMMSKRKRKNPQKCQVDGSAAMRASEGGLVSNAAVKDNGASAEGGDQALRVPVPPGAPLMVPSYNLMHNAAQYNLAATGQAWKHSGGMNYGHAGDGNFAADNRANRGGGVMDLRQQQQGQFDSGPQDDHVSKHGHYSGGAGSGKSGKGDKMPDMSAATHMDNRRGSPPRLNDGGNSMHHQLAASLRSGLPRMNEVWGPHFVDKTTGWLRMPNAQGFTAPFFNNGMPNFVFNWPLQQAAGLPISSAAAIGKTGNNAADKHEPNRGGSEGSGLYNAYDLADLGGQPGFFGQGWPPNMNPY
jgi:uncharacterized Zn-finger protein